MRRYVTGCLVGIACGNFRMPRPLPRRVRVSAECPSWFAPKPLTEYEIWTYADDASSNFRLLIDKQTGHIFLADYQV